MDKKKGLAIYRMDNANLVSITEVNRNFSKAARIVDQKGSEVILKNNMPKYIVIEFSQAEKCKKQKMMIF